MPETAIFSNNKNLHVSTPGIAVACPLLSIRPWYYLDFAFGGVRFACLFHSCPSALPILVTSLNSEPQHAKTQVPSSNSTRQLTLVFVVTKFTGY